MTAPVGDVTIDALEVATYTIPTDFPEADGTLSWDSTTVVTVVARAGDGCGLGWTYTTGAAAAVVEDLLAPVVAGRNAFDPAAANEAMSRAVRNAGRPGIAATAISAVDIALWDLKATLLGLPLHRLLGGQGDPVAVYGSGGFTTYDDARTARQVEAWVEQCGVRSVKIKVGESWGTCEDRDIARAGFVRDLLDGRELFVDANGGYTVAQAVRMGRRYDELGVTWFEEPVSSDDLPALRHIRRLVEADVAAGEYGYALPYFARMVGAGAVDCLQVDVTRCGGITDFVRAGAIAAASGLDVSGHCAPHLHAAFAGILPNLRHVEYFHDHARIEEQLLFDGAEPARDGMLSPCRDRAGHGLALREDADQWRVR
ncbi:MAG TPA: enolase C-terminal domain-like protein [Mycobacteriales bacterium]|nr:enolase C-terminal domain-like protein [Mycobacteriales bacterium]